MEMRQVPLRSSATHAGQLRYLRCREFLAGGGQHLFDGLKREIRPAFCLGQLAWPEQRTEGAVYAALVERDVSA